MSIYIGNNKYKEIYLGSNKISEVYLGSNKIYGSSSTSILYYSKPEEVIGATKVTTSLNITAQPYLVIKYDSKVTYGGAGGVYFNFGTVTVQTRDHTYYHGSHTSVLETSTSQQSTIYGSNITRYSLDSKYNYFNTAVSPETYSNHAYIINIANGITKVYFNKTYAIYTNYNTTFNTLEYYQTTREVNQTPYIKNIEIYGFAREVDAINYVTG